MNPTWQAIPGIVELALRQVGFVIDPVNEDRQDGLWQLEALGDTACHPEVKSWIEQSLFR